MQVLVTVGTTKFPELVTAAMDPEVATLLLSMGYQHMEIQVCGTGNQNKTHISGIKSMLLILPGPCTLGYSFAI